MSKEMKRSSVEDFYKSGKKSIKNLDILLEQAQVAMNLEDEMRALRKREKVTQKDLAKRMNIAQTNISRIENDILHAKFDAVLTYLSALGKTMKIVVVDSEVDTSKQHDWPPEYLDKT